MRTINIEKLINELAKNVSKSMLNKKEESSEAIDLKSIGAGDILQIILKRFINDGEYSKAENLIFEAIHTNKTEEVYSIAMDFYDLLLQKSEEELKAGNFSREEINQGIQDLKRLYAEC